MALTDLLPPSFKGYLRFKRGRHSDFYPYGGAMNGQTFRLNAVRQVIHDCGVQEIIETGTFRATTTEWLSQFNVPVVTIESHSPTYHFARRRIAPLPNVKIEFGNSAEVLTGLLRTRPRDRVTLLYLDAHWEDFLPLKDELDAVAAHLDRAIVLIDDFEVPGDVGYTYDNYGPGKALTAGYIDTTAAKDFARFYPSVPSNEETGIRRGWIVLARNPALVAKLDAIESLRR